jgi:hypothetical protein
MPPLDVVSDAVAEGLELSVAESDGDELGEADPVEVGVVAVGVGDGEAEAEGVPVAVDVGVAVGLPLVVGLGAPVGVAAGQAGDDVAE